MYIGYTNDTTKRWKAHINCSLNKRKESDYPLYKSIRKYGVNNFQLDIIEEFEKKELALSTERLLIKTLNTQNREVGYNIHEGGLGGYTNYDNHTAKLSGSNNPMYGKKHSQESKAKLSKSISHWRNNTESGMAHSEMHRNRMSGEGNWNYGKVMPENRKQKMIETKKKNPTKIHSITQYTLVNLETNDQFIALGQSEYLLMLKTHGLSSWSAEAIMRGKPTKSAAWRNYSISRVKKPRVDVLLSP